MTRAVVDTNVLVRGATAQAGSLAAVIYDAWIDGRFDLVVSRFSLDELRRVLAKPYFVQLLTADMARAIIDTLEHGAEHTEITTRVFGVGTHWQDDLIVSTAVSGKSDYLVTEDEELLAARSHDHVQIVTPQEFCDDLGL